MMKKLYLAIVTIILSGLVGNSITASNDPFKNDPFFRNHTRSAYAGVSVIQPQSTIHNAAAHIITTQHNIQTRSIERANTNAMQFNNNNDKGIQCSCSCCCCGFKDTDAGSTFWCCCCTPFKANN